MDIRTVEQLLELTKQPARSEEHAALQQVLEHFPVRLTKHLFELIPRSAAVARQYLPDAREISSAWGETDCFVGLVPTGVAGVERIYTDRCVLLPHAQCPAYCRFCFRKFHRQRREAALSAEELDRCLAYVASHPELREVLITGGEPLLDRHRLARLLAGLRTIPHVSVIRVGCRALVSCPELVDDELAQLLAAHQDLSVGRPVEVAAHLNHPDELTAPTLAALLRLQRAGLHIYSQTVLLRGVNATAEILEQLLGMMRQHGVETYALFYPEPVLGMDHVRPTMNEARALKRALRARLSGRSNPHLLVTTRIGKVELDVDGWELEREADGRHVWLRTPYTLSAFRALDPGFALPSGTRVDAEGYLEVRYLDGASAAEVTE